MPSTTRPDLHTWILSWTTYSSPTREIWSSAISGYQPLHLASFPKSWALRLTWRLKYITQDKLHVWQSTQTSSLWEFSSSLWLSELPHSTQLSPKTRTLSFWRWNQGRLTSSNSILTLEPFSGKDSLTKTCKNCWFPCSFQIHLWECKILKT